MAAATALLAEAGITSARTDAELLAAHVLGVPRSGLMLATAMTRAQAERYEALLFRRAARVPLQHLVGAAPFRGLEVAVGPGVFIPRPETELLVEWGIGALPAGATVVDLCSGSGAIALAVASERPDTTVHAVELDASAATWLARNTSGTAVSVVCGDATSADALADLDGLVDLVLCNPPYVPAGTPVEPEVADHDPGRAVFAGADGLDVIRGIVARAASLLRLGGRLAIEHDASHGDAVVRLLTEDGRYEEAMDHVDLAGRSRFATAVRGSGPGRGLADLQS
ncbi:MAG: peptide chain release factor N(5)-glutamine methyltransferase [Micromonosporaceae bacterium]|nr:peptide chain release factor N(5)-glutamine methyltransferase [Micromonosporaceae bacterium]